MKKKDSRFVMARGRKRKKDEWLMLAASLTCVERTLPYELEAAAAAKKPSN